MKALEKKMEKTLEKMDQLMEAMLKMIPVSNSANAGTRPLIQIGDYMKILPFDRRENPFEEEDLEWEEARKYIGVVGEVRELICKTYEGRKVLKVIGLKVPGSRKITGSFKPYQLELLTTYSTIETRKP